MDGWEQVKPLLFIGAMIYTMLQAFSLEFGVYHCGPRFPPVFQRFGASPIGGRNSIKAVCKLSFLASFHLLHRIPENCSVLVLGGNI